MEKHSEKQKKKKKTSSVKFDRVSNYDIKLISRIRCVTS